MRQKKSKLFLYIILILLVILGYFSSKEFEIKQEEVVKEINIKEIMPEQ